MKSAGRKEVIEAVLVASLCAAATGLISWGIEHLRNVFTPPKPPAKRKPVDEDEDAPEDDGAQAPKPEDKTAKEKNPNIN